MHEILRFPRHYQLWFFSKNWQRYDKTQESGVGRWLIYQPLAGFLLTGIFLPCKRRLFILTQDKPDLQLRFQTPVECAHLTNGCVSGWSWTPFLPQTQQQEPLGLALRMKMSQEMMVDIPVFGCDRDISKNGMKWSKIADTFLFESGHQMKLDFMSNKGKR